MASAVPTIRILPLRDGESSPADELLARAEALGIPWRRLLAQEIEAEERLRTYLADIDAEASFETALDILATEASRSWRVRDQLETLAWQARASVRGAAGRLRRFVRSLSDESGWHPAGPSSAVRRCGAAYRRILLLQRAWRAASRSRGSMAERLAFVCATARCRFEDAEWALSAVAPHAPRRGRRMEAAVRKVRDEGFFVPRAATDARSLAQLRRIVFAAEGRSSRAERGIPNSLVSTYGNRDVSSKSRRARAS